MINFLIPNLPPKSNVYPNWGVGTVVKSPSQGPWMLMSNAALSQRGWTYSVNHPHRYGKTFQLQALEREPLHTRMSRFRTNMFYSRSYHGPISPLDILIYHIWYIISIYYYYISQTSTPFPTTVLSLRKGRFESCLTSSQVKWATWQWKRGIYGIYNGNPIYLISISIDTFYDHDYFTLIK